MTSPDRSEAEPPRARRAAILTLAALLAGPLLGAVVPEIVARSSDRLWARTIDREVLDARRADVILGAARPGDVDVIVVGSSIAHCAVDEDLLARRLLPRRIRAVHLAWGAASPEGVAMLAPRITALRPRAIVYALSRVDFSTADRQERAAFYDPRVARRVHSTAEIVADRDDHLAGLAAWASVVHRRAPLVLLDALLPDRGPQLTADMRDARPVGPDRMRRFVESADRAIATSSIGAGSIGARALGELARRAAAAGIPLLFVQSPLHASVSAATRDTDGFAGDLEALLDALAADHGALRVRGAELGGFRAAELRDATHLATPGRGRVTAAVARALEGAIDRAPGGHGLQ